MKIVLEEEELSALLDMAALSEGFQALCQTEIDWNTKNGKIVPEGRALEIIAAFKEELDKHRAKLPYMIEEFLDIRWREFDP